MTNDLAWLLYGMADLGLFAIAGLTWGLWQDGG